jgi:hypothetical protein
VLVSRLPRPYQPARAAARPVRTLFRSHRCAPSAVLPTPPHPPPPPLRRSGGISISGGGWGGEGRGGGRIATSTPRRSPTSAGAESSSIGPAESTLVSLSFRFVRQLSISERLSERLRGVIARRKRGHAVCRHRKRHGSPTCRT